MASHVSDDDHVSCDGSIRTAWPLLRGLMSRKAYVLSLSKSFMDGISPAGVVRGNCTASITSAACGVAAYTPLMILQKMHAAAMLGGGGSGMRV
jgi:hypothetical protein